jgi:Kef-type K+ transport system membrane component KefB
MTRIGGRTQYDRPVKRTLLLYGIIVVGAALAVIAILQFGDTHYLDALTGGVTHSQAQAQAAQVTQAAQSQGASAYANLRHPLAVLIIQLIVVVLTARVFGYWATRLGQPPVIGEIIAGLALGPSLLGWAWPAAARFVFPVSSLGTLQLFSQVGVILFMFVAGLELDTRHLRHRAHTAVAVSHVSIVLPFLLGVSLALVMYSSYAPAGVPFHAFALFMGIAMSITAFPVLARILSDQNLMATPLGSTAITCAAVDDVTAWTLLAMVVAIATQGAALGVLATITVWAIAFVLLMLYVVRPWLASLFDRPAGETPVTRERVALVLAVVFGAALFTEALGVHALFGAFVAGVCMPAMPEVRDQLRERLESFATVFLLPVFFAFTGLRTELGLLTDINGWIMCAVIILIATVGKLGGSMLAARFTGMDWNGAFMLGALMNTRGLMELVALNVGYELGVLSPRLFTMMVVMALVTTAMTGPLLQLARHRERALGDKSLIPT